MAHCLTHSANIVYCHHYCLAPTQPVSVTSLGRSHSGGWEQHQEVWASVFLRGTLSRKSGQRVKLKQTDVLKWWILGPWHRKGEKQVWFPTDGTKRKYCPVNWGPGELEPLWKKEESWLGHQTPGLTGRNQETDLAMLCGLGLLEEWCWMTFLSEYGLFRELNLLLGVSEQGNSQVDRCLNYYRFLSVSFVYRLLSHIIIPSSSELTLRKTKKRKLYFGIL